MAIFMSCPSCNRPGNLPDSFRGGKVKCPGCGVVTEIPGSGIPAKPPAPSAPAARASALPARPAPAPAAARPQPPKRSILDEMDDDGDAPAAPPPSRTRTSRSAPQEAPRSNLPVMIGVGGGAALLLAVVVGFVTMQGRPEEAQGPAAAPANRAIEQARADAAPSGPMAAAPSYQPSAPPQQPYEAVSPQEAIRRAKDATVFVKVKDGKSQGTGTGFVIKVEGDSVLIATNRHVVSHSGTPDGEGDDEEDDDSKAPRPASPGAARPDAAVSVVFRSGEGAGKEQEVAAVVLGKDTTGDPSRDLAILRVKGVTNPPRAIETNRSVQPTEGMALRIFGFPFGQSLNMTNAGNPAITVNNASVSSLRRDERGQLVLIQVDGSVHPGNSGGPIVDQDGRLIGVTVAKFSAVDGIGLAIPAAHLDEILAGRPGRLTVERASQGSSSLELRVSMDLADPLGRLKTINFHVAASDGKPPAAAQATAAIMPGATTVPMTIAPDRKTASATISVPNLGSSANVLVQFTFVSGDNRNYFSIPAVHVVPPAPGRLLAVNQGDGERASKIEAKIKATLKKLGELIDPDKDCVEVRDKKGVKITIPAKLHTVSPQIVDKKNKPIMNAPRLLAPITGDFLMHVRVAGSMRPGTEPLKDPKGRSLGIAFQGAGIVLWEDQNNFVRLERTCGTAGGLTLVSRLLVEVYKDGKESGHFYHDVPDGPMNLMMARKDGAIRCLFSNDGKKWSVMRELAADYAPKVQVGLIGVNMSKKVFIAQFEDFALIEDKDKIAEEFGIK